MDSVKTKFRITLAMLSAAAVLLLTGSCQKEIADSAQAEEINVSVSAILGDLTPVGETTKAEMAPYIRLTWEEGDSVSVFSHDSRLGKLGVTPQDGGVRALLSGTIEVNQGYSADNIITLVYSNVSSPDIMGGTISFDLSRQDGTVANPFVAYGTLTFSDFVKGEGFDKELSGKVIPFKFATSLMRVGVTGLVEDTPVDNVVFYGMNTCCQLKLNSGGEPEVSGTGNGIIERSGIITSMDERALFSVSFAPTDASGNNARKIVAYQGVKRLCASFTSSAIDPSKSYISAYALKEADGSRGTINGHDYVLIAGKKWATQNLAVTDYGNAIWGGGTKNKTAVKVPGSADEDVILGDCFQWAAHEGYCGNKTDADRGLLAYTGIGHKCCIESSTYWCTAKEDFQFSKTTPYLSTINQEGKATYTKYGSGDILSLDDDVAHILWEDTWRMPTYNDFEEMLGATKQKYYVDTDGLYVFLPEDWNLFEGFPGKEKAVLFFPNTGGLFKNQEDGFDFSTGGTYFWTSSLGLDDKAYSFWFSGYDIIYPYDLEERYQALPVRPVSD